MKIAAWITLPLLASSCVTSLDMEPFMASLWNVESSRQSKFDGVSYWSISDIPCNQVMLDLTQSDKLKKKDQVLLTAKTLRAYNIDEGESLQLNIDGELHKFTSPQTSTSIESRYFGGKLYNESSKGYVMKMAFIEKLASANSIVIRLQGLNKLIETECISDKTYRNNEITNKTTPTYEIFSTQSGFKKFINLARSH